jgi:hypothetical protein
VSRDLSQQPGQEPAHDVLAAEAFAVPTADPGLRRPVQLPDDPSGIAEPHDILAAEEFAMPVARGPGGSDRARKRTETQRRMAILAAAGGLLGFLRLRRGR